WPSAPDHPKNHAGTALHHANGLDPRGSKIGLISGLFLVVSLLVIWREARQVRANRDLDNRG
ncbi:hypothetical protein, partial [Kocuria nitroreducens]|uniref:hypothetical protein n=1 Tax=Kocuria nitroreducens TaxID=3058914 RepID=UPI0036DB435A